LLSLDILIQQRTIDIVASSKPCYPFQNQWTFAFEILRRTSQFDFPSLEDNDLVYHVEELFLALDQEEAING
jgi:hypothetical protein